MGGLSALASRTGRRVTHAHTHAHTHTHTHTVTHSDTRTHELAGEQRQEAPGRYRAKREMHCHRRSVRICEYFDGEEQIGVLNRLEPPNSRKEKEAIVED